MKMKFLIPLCLLSTISLSQNITLPKNKTTTVPSGHYDSITYSDSSRVLILGEVYVKNLNINGQNTKTTVKGGLFDVTSSINLNGGDTLEVIQGGKVRCKNLEEQSVKPNEVFVNSGGSIEVDGDWQISNSNSGATICGSSSSVNITKSLNLNGDAKEGALKLCECATITSDNINVNADRVIVGAGTLIFSKINLNHIFTNSTNIYVKYGGQSPINKPENWGSAKVNSPTETCYGAVLPVVIESVDFVTESIEGVDRVIYDIKLSPESNLKFFEIQTSIDGKNWTTVKKVYNQANVFKYRDIVE